MKTDFEILIAMLILSRAITSIKFTHRHTLLNPQLKSLSKDMTQAYRLAYHKVSEYHESDNTGLGKKFIYLYGVFVTLSNTTPTIAEEDGLLSIMGDSEVHWDQISKVLHIGFSKNRGLELFEEKRKLCYLGLGMIMAVGSNPQFVPRKSQAVLHQLLDRIFEYAETIPFNRTSIMNELEMRRYAAICSIYRMLELIKQAATLTRDGGGRKAPHVEHVECYSNRPDHDSVSAVGNMTDVLWIRAALNCTVYKDFERAYRKFEERKT